MLFLSRYARWKAAKGNPQWTRFVLLPGYEAVIMSKKLSLLGQMLCEMFMALEPSIYYSPDHQTLGMVEKGKCGAASIYFVFSYCLASLYVWTYPAVIFYLCADNGGSKTMKRAVAATLLGTFMTAFILWGEVMLRILGCDLGHRAIGRYHWGWVQVSCVRCTL